MPHAGQQGVGAVPAPEDDVHPVPEVRPHRPHRPRRGRHLRRYGRFCHFLALYLLYIVFLHFFIIAFKDVHGFCIDHHLIFYHRKLRVVREDVCFAMVFFNMYLPLALDVYNRLFIDSLGLMAVDEIRKHE